MKQNNEWTKRATGGVLLALVLVLPSASAILDDLTWTTGGTDPSWEYGANGEGESVWATGLNAPHNHPECSWIESAPIPGFVLDSDNLTMLHSYDMEAFRHPAIGVIIGAEDGGIALVSKDDGASWQKVGMDYPIQRLRALGDNHACLSDWLGGGLGGGGYFTGTETNVTNTGGIGEIHPADLVKIRFGFFADSSNTGNGRQGWEIQSVNLGGVDLLPLLGVDTNDGPLP